MNGYDIIDRVTDRAMRVLLKKCVEDTESHYSSLTAVVAFSLDVNKLKLDRYVSEDQVEHLYRAILTEICMNEYKATLHNVYVLRDTYTSEELRCYLANNTEFESVSRPGKTNPGLRGEKEYAAVYDDVNLTTGEISADELFDNVIADQKASITKRKLLL